MKLESLETLNDDELRAIIARADALLKQHDTERKEKALEQARATLAAVGLSLKDLNGKARKSKGAVYHAGRTYRHPANKALVWAAKGKKPQWLSELEAEGRKPIQVEPTNDNALPGREANDNVAPMGGNKARKVE